MHHQTLLAAYGGLLHDVGKIAYRSGGRKMNHSAKGYDFLLDCWKGRKTEDRKTVLDCVRYHHQEYLKDASLPPDSLAWIVYYADNIAASADRREEENGTDSAYFDIRQPLKPVFTKLNGQHDGFAVPPYLPGSPAAGGRFLPVPENSRPLSMEDYQTILSAIGERVRFLSLADWELNPLLLFLEDSTGTVPSSTYTGEVPDVSLYDHMKITAAVASCLSEYVLAEGITDFKTAFFQRGTAFRDRPTFLLYSADMSGIQKFIYTVSIKRALRSLRSRSLFLELAMEHYVDELLCACGLSRANLLYIGGGHCYLLLPNTAKTVETLETWNRRFNDWLTDTFGIRLYLADGWTECTANDLTNNPKKAAPYKAMFRRVSRAVAQKKLHRYTAEQVLRMNETYTDDTGRECRVCGRSDTLVPDRDGAAYVCRWCALFEDLTRDLSKKTAYILQRGSGGGVDLPLPLQDGGEAFLRLTDKETAIRASTGAVRLYVRNEPSLEGTCTARLNAGVYASGDSMDDLAEASEGIKRLGVCRMDVDNLGLAFVVGFEQRDRPDRDPERYRYVTISRTSAFSRQMSLFFKHYVNGLLDGSAGICSDGLTSGPAKPLNVALVYSGGDDVFLVGAWNDALEAAQRIQWALDRFTCGALTISAGLGLFRPHEPVRMAAEQTARLEDASKDLDGKNAITLFDAAPGFTFPWDDFRERVLGEKMETLSRFFDNPRNGRGKSLLYRILQLLRESQEWYLDGHSGKGIALARYAYLLSRLAPSGRRDTPEYREYEEFARKMYDWGISPRDREQLMMAMQLYVYQNRTRAED